MTDQYEQDRRVKLQQLQALGLQPYCSSLVPEISISNLIWEMDVFKDANPDNGPIHCIAGRIMLYRAMGSLIFIKLRDATGDFQVAFSKKRIAADLFAAAKKLDLGDVIVVKGPTGPSQTGELTLWATELAVAAKSLVPPPAKHEGLSDVEARYRQRYVDLWANPEVAKVFEQRSDIIFHIRRLLRETGYMEVETPMMQSIPGGAIAKPFVTHHNALDIDLYMRIAPELYLKRLLVGGFSRVFEIGRNFRNEGISTRHNPEFTALEAYEAYGSYVSMAEMAEDLITRIAHATIPGAQIANGKQTVNGVDFSRPWPRVRMVDLAKEHGHVFDGDYAGLLNFYEKEVEPKLIRPTFVYNPPSSAVPLAKESANTGFADAFELVINGMELGCGYSEQNNPDEQEKHFRNQAGPEDERQKIDFDFLNALKVGMPPAGGIGIGIDRLVMVLTGAKSARDVILFPTLKQTEQS